MNLTNMTTTEAAASRQANPLCRLFFPHGVANLTLSVDATLTQRYQAVFDGPKPTVSETEEAISIDYPRFNALIWGRTSADVRISRDLAWAIDIRGGVSGWDGDLREGELTGVRVHGGASRVALQLPRPAGSVDLLVTGGVSRLTVTRPGDVPARLHIGGGASRVRLDHQEFGAIGGPLQIESGDYARVAARYRVEIGGGASRVAIEPC